MLKGFFYENHAQQNRTASCVKRRPDVINAITSEADSGHFHAPFVSGVSKVSCHLKFTGNLTCDRPITFDPAKQMHILQVMEKPIQILGARVHNLKNINVDIPRNKLVVITGVSGSGKSSLAFDTLFAEGQRRFIESLSAYARQFLMRMERPDVDEIRGISPAVAIEQKIPPKSPRSTVATATEIHDYLRLLYARIGRTVCGSCKREIKQDTVQDAIEKIDQLAPETKIQIVFPLSHHKPAERALEISDYKTRGFFRLLFGKKLVNIDDLKPSMLRTKKIYMLVDRLKTGMNDTNRLADSLELAFREGHGFVTVFVENEKSMQFSQKLHCAQCNIDFITPQPRLFSFNNPLGACKRCNGFGAIIELDLDLVIPDDSRSLQQGAVVPWNTQKRRDIFAKMMNFVVLRGIDVTTPWRDLPEAHKQLVIDGQPPFPGIKGFFKRLEKKNYKIGVRVLLSRYRGQVGCPDCQKTRLCPEALNVRIDHKSIGELAQLSIEESLDFFKKLELSKFDENIAGQILKELRSRLSYLVDVGLGYLTLDRRTQYLSGGEYQRINLATAVGFKLVGSLYVLDEPSIGLHPKDNRRLIKILLALRDFGNTVVVVEHDREMMEIADYIIDLGPAAGEHGGNLVYQGAYKDMISNGTTTLTADYLNGIRKIEIPATRNPGNGRYLSVINARQNNLKGITVRIPLGLLCCVTGVSGSGKSTLVHDVLYAGIAKTLQKWDKPTGKSDKIDGIEYLDDIVLVDQAPIGRSPRSNAITYIKAFDGIRELFAQTQRAKMRGLKPGAFSFNTPGGRCERCEGAGVEKVEMLFLSDLYLTCEECKGERYRDDILDIRYKGKNIFETLNLTVAEALDFFHGAGKIINKIQALQDVGLGYLRLGQPATTLSGGEAQRVKLASHLSDTSKRHVLYIFDEPTTGLHFHDIAKLVESFRRLQLNGHSLLIIEHNPDVIKIADHLIDLGPDAGNDGGYLVAEGTPEQVAANEKSHTGAFLKEYLTSI